MKIMMIRHGETDWNVHNWIQGESDIPLNKKGIAQAAEAGIRMKDTPIDRIYSSDMIRAMQTSQQIAQYHSTPLEIVETPALREQNFGIWEGRPRDDEEYQAEKHLYFKRFDGGESFLDVAARVYPFLDKIIEENPDDSVLLLSSHGGILRMIASYFEGLSNPEFVEYFARNCECTVFDFCKDDWKLSRNRWILEN